MRTFVAAFLAVVVSLPASATEQIPDLLLIAYRWYEIDDLPLSQLYTDDELSGLLEPEICSGSWHGYRARWQLEGGRLWLKSVQRNPCSDRYDPIEAAIFSDDAEYPIRADWYSGTISLPIGEFDRVSGAAGENLGFDLEVLSFRFENGRLVSKDIEIREVRYDRP